MDAADILENSLSQTAFTRMAGYITSELGIKMPESKMPMVQSRLLRRVRELRLSSVEEYADYFFDAAHEAEREHFINAITTNKTDFFREPSHFDFLTRSALPSLFPAGAPVRLNLWSAGCSSGEEVWTLAMVLSEYALRSPGFDFAILGTDVSTRVLDRARAAIYDEELVRPVPLTLRARYLRRKRDPQHPLVRIAPQLREKAGFFQLNLMDGDFPIRNEFEIVFFRNVLIYFERETQEAVINRICRHLCPGGYLFVGHSESLAALDVPVTAVHPAVFRKTGAER